MDAERLVRIRSVGHGTRYPNAAYLDLARKDVAELLAEVERLQAELAALTAQRDALTRMQEAKP